MTYFKKIHFKTIRLRILMMLTLIIGVLALFISLYLWNDTKSRAYKSFDSITQTINNVLLANIKGFIYNDDKESVQYVIDSIKSKYIYNILILDAKGHVISSQKNNNDKKIYQHYKDILQSKTHSIKDEKNYIILNTFELLEVPLGYLIVEGNVKYYLGELNKELLDLAVLILLFLLFAMTVALYVSRSISKPLQSIIRTLQNTHEHEVLLFEDASEEEFKYLIKTITEKHNDLLNLNMQLEEKIDLKTIELQTLNATLEEKIHKAVTDAQTKEQLFQQQARLAQMGEMLSMIAHQWRQPLTAMGSSLMLIDRYIETDKFNLNTKDGRTSFVTFLENSHADIHDHIDYLSHTTDDFRNFFNPHTQKEIISLNVPINKALKLIKTSIINQNIKFTIALNSKKTCSIYQNEIIQVILNLLKNASDALQEANQKQKHLSIMS
ncbi:MAG: hypothetical protein DRQ78_09825, partial [Epsilonproteobacteria bacterium]